MATKSIKITIDSALNASGFRKAEAELNTLAGNVKKAGSSLTRIAGAAGLIWASFRGGFEIGKKLRNVYVDLFTSARHEAAKAELACSEFNKAIERIPAEQVEKVSREYKKLTDQISAAADARARFNKMQSEYNGLNRKNADAESELAKQRELAALAPGDEKGAAAIERKYAIEAESKALERAKEDILSRRKSLEAEAKANLDAADSMEKYIKTLERAASYKRASAKTNAILSTQTNESDITWKTRFLGWPVGFTEAGNAVRKSQAEKSRSEAKEALAIEEKIRDIRSQIEKKRSDASAALFSASGTSNEIKALEKKYEAATIVIKKKLNLFGGNPEESEFVKEYEKSQKKEVFEFERTAMKKLHDERMKQLDNEQAKVQKQIDAAKAKGFDNLMATAGGGYYGNGTLDQGNEERERRQRVIGAQRAVDAEQNLRDKMAKVGASLDDPTKLGRMSNLERAAFERLKLKDAEAKAAKIQKEKDAREKKMSEDLDAINKKLKEVGL